MVVVLPAKYADAIKDNKDLSFGKMLQKVGSVWISTVVISKQCAGLPCRPSRFSAFQTRHYERSNLPRRDQAKSHARPWYADPSLVRLLVSMSVGLSFTDRLTEPVSEETVNALQKHWTDDEGTWDWRSSSSEARLMVFSEWHDINTNATALQIAAQMSSRVFVGDQLCRDEHWLRITINYTLDAITGALALRLWPSFARPAIHWFLPYCQKIRKHLAEGRAIINPVLEKRRSEKRTAAADGNVAERHPDALEWLEEVAKGRTYDPVTAQVMMSLAAIHTLSDALTQVLHDLCEHPEVMQRLREEIGSVVHEHGWQKSTLYNLKLMDSVLKESQRLKPAALGKQ